MEQTKIGTTPIGIVLAFVIIAGVYVYEGGSIESFFMLPAMSIVIGGTLLATFAGTPIARFIAIPRLVFLTFKPKTFAIADVIEQLVEFNTIVRREGLLVLRERLYNAEHSFFRKLLRCCMDGMNSEQITQIATVEMDAISQRHKENIHIFKSMAGYSPTMGIIGTVIGLITTLGAVDSNPAMLINNIAMAFIATLWGIVMANLVWLPIAERLNQLHLDEMKLLNVILDGVVAMQEGNTPSVTRAELASVLPPVQQEELMSRPLPRAKITPIEMPD
jgi:chemotaxis protein MotA